MTIRIAKRAVVSAVSAAVLVACGKAREPAVVEPVAPSSGAEAAQNEVHEPPGLAPTPGRSARGDFQAAPGVTLTGSAEFSFQQQPLSVRAMVSIANATPGKHGIHVHEKPDCSDIPAKSMGSHFAPQGNEHGLPSSTSHHLGDLGNIEVAADGTGKLEIDVLDATLDQGPNSFVGRAIVIHEKEDNGKGVSGESGPPIACAIIESESDR